LEAPLILIIDDEQFMRRIVRQTLLSLGYGNIAEADSGAAAKCLFEKKAFDLIISDIYMPHMSGLELLKSIRLGRTKAPSDSRVIFLTSFSNTEILKTSMELGVNGFLVKPIKSDMVKKKILQALNEHMLLKDEEMYESIKIDTQWASQLKKEKVVSVGSNKTSQTKEPEPVGPIQETETIKDNQLPEGVIMASTLQITPGSILAEDIITKDGTLLLSTGQKLNQQLINRIHDLRSILRFENIKIKPPAEESNTN